MAEAVHRDEHRMQALVRFREVGREQNAHYVAWFEPEHHIVAATAPFFASRFADMPWSILTPDVCAHWDGHAVSITAGISKAEAPTEDRLEEFWRRYLREHLQSGPAEGEGDRSRRKPKEYLEEPAGSLDH